MRVVIFISLVVILLISIFFVFFTPKDSGEKKIINIISSVLSEKSENRNSFQKKDDIMKKFGTDRLVFLILGLDHNWVEGHKPTSQGARSDAIILVTLDLYNQQVRLLSIPRDLRIYYKDYGYYDKINSAVVLGGAKLTRKIISELFGVHIDYTITIKQQAIKNLVDCIGGVYIDVEKDMFYEDRWGNLSINLKKGRQLLNGEQVIGYMRFRMDEEGDLGRIRRQNQAITQIMEQLPSKLNSSNIMSIIDNVLPYIQTDLNKEKIILLVKYMSSFKISYRSYKLPVISMEIDGVSYVQTQDYKEVIKAWYRGYQKLGIINACHVNNNMDVYNKYIHGSKFYLNGTEFFDEYIPISIILQKEETEKNSLYYILPFGKVMTLKEFIYNRYIDTKSEIYIRKTFLYDTEISKLMNFYNSNDVILILGEDSVGK